MPLYGSEVNAQTGTTYTLVLSDDGKLVTLTNGSAITLTVPPQSSVDWAAAAEVEIAQLGAGLVTVAAGSGVTIRSAGGYLALKGQYSAARLHRLSSDLWILHGSGVAVS